MRLKCLDDTPMDDTVRELARHARPDKNDYDLVIGREYVAMGLGFWDGETWAEIATDGGFMLSVPLSKFEIVHGTPSAFWELRQGEGAVRLWPPSFYEGTYHSDLADRVSEIVADFEVIRSKLEAEDRRQLSRI